MYCSLKSKQKKVTFLHCKSIGCRNLRLLDLQQKYIEDRGAIVVSVDFLLKLELYPEEIATALLDSIYLMKRVVVDDISLGVAINIDASSAVFFLVQFDMLTAYETRVRDFSLITSDQYLDLVLDKKVLK